jgi:hypothetical protein
MALARDAASPGLLRRRLSAAESFGRVEPWLGDEIRGLVAALPVEWSGGGRRGGACRCLRQEPRRCEPLGPAPRTPVGAEEPGFARRLDQLDRRLARALEQ